MILRKNLCVPRHKAPHRPSFFHYCHEVSLHNFITFPMQVLSKRIHYGKFVAEAKFQGAPDIYQPAIRAQVDFITRGPGIKSL